MDTLQKLDILGASADYDICSPGSQQTGLFPTAAGRRRGIPGVYQSTVSRGQKLALLKVLFTNVCEKDCAYCAFRAAKDGVRTSFQPEELARTFVDMHDAGLVDGLFLSSGVAGSADMTMERMLQTVEIIRKTHRFQGYVHVKVLPGAKLEYVEWAARLASRLSININMEAPTAGHLAKLTSAKDLDQDILRRMRWIAALRDEDGLLPSGQTTQFMVGPAGESDRDIMRAAAWLYRDLGLSRAYFSAFRPIEGTPLEGQPAVAPQREHRLYQMDWLQRHYPFDEDELALAFREDGNLDLEADPKEVIASRCPEIYPVEVNVAPLHLLLRVPGIGPVSGARIVAMRREHRFSTAEQLRKVGVVTARALPFLTVAGRQIKNSPAWYCRRAPAKRHQAEGYQLSFDF